MKRIAMAVLLACGGLSTQAADLLEIYRDALASDAQFASARAQYEANQEKGPQGRAGMLPTVNLTGNTSYTWADTILAAPRSYNYNTNAYQVQLVQPIFRWQNVEAYRQGNLQVDVAEAQFLTARNDLALRAAQTYFDVLYAEEVLNSVQALKSATAEQLQLAKKSFEVGTVTVTDVNEAQSKFDLAAAQEIAAQNDLDVKRQALSLLSGKPPQSLARLRPGVQIAPPLPANIDDWVRSAEKNNAAVQASTLAVEIAERDVTKARAGHLPTLDFVATHGNSHAGRTASADTASMSRNNAVGLQLSVPIFAGGATQSKVREALALKTKAEADLETQRRVATQAARQAYLGVTSGIAQVRGYEAAVVSSTSAVASNKLGYEVGVRINIDVLNAQSTLADTQQKLAKARYDTLINQLKLKAATGPVEQGDIEQVNALLSK
ncbi:TolC family outer membrane protein [Viridibacterium curvum]|uniref:TolC family outer membrane protein n=1 Tax=Viridibacterium curvum TaxID=1101404 RepID=A0ABP9QLN0_9RHOO